MAPRKTKTQASPEQSNLVVADSSGFAEAPQAFQTQAHDDARFDESVELMRSFSRIDNAQARRRVIDLARQCADDQQSGDTN